MTKVLPFIESEETRKPNSGKNHSEKQCSLFAFQRNILYNLMLVADFFFFYIHPKCKITLAVKRPI